MYLRSITLKNTGPIQELDLTLPFEGDKPKPLVLVGRNGSGKSTVLSFVVNALIALKQKAYNNTEVIDGRVYRVRSPLAINGNAQFFFARVNFDKAVSLVEWQLTNTKKLIQNEDVLATIDPSWAEIPEHETSFFRLHMGQIADDHAVEAELANNCQLFFAADRFEPPDWLNGEGLSSELRLPEPIRMKGATARRIISRNRLKPTLEWLSSVMFDLMLEKQLPVRMQSFRDVNVPSAPPSKVASIIGAVTTIISTVLAADADETAQLGIGNRNGRIISATFKRGTQETRRLGDLLSLSAGESALFCIFASIIRDADMSAMQFEKPEDISGIVLIDEADLHLHLALQLEAFPKLIALFPRIQFVVTIHAPLVALGLERVLGASGFEIREMPSGTLTSPEAYSEFLNAFDVLTATKKFQAEILTRINSASLPALLVEGKTDAAIINTAWKKLHPSLPVPFEIIAAGVQPDPEKREGGADTLRRCTEYLTIVVDRPFISLFDNDFAGATHFNSLSDKAGFNTGIDSAHKRHAKKSINAILLPSPTTRTDFASSPKIAHRHLSIEHYFSDEILSKFELKGNPVLAGTTVFEIEGSSAKKVTFALATENFGVDEFKNFQLIFDRISTVSKKS